MNCSSIGLDPGPARARLDSSILQPHPVKHQLAATLKLQAKPIPPDFTAPELAARPFVIEPGLPVHSPGFAVHGDFAAAFQTRERIIMGRARCAGGLHADTVFTVDHRRSCKTQMEANRPSTARSCDIPFLIAGRCQAPILNPDQTLAVIEPRFAKCAAAI